MEAPFVHPQTSSSSHEDKLHQITYEIDRIKDKMEYEVKDQLWWKMNLHLITCACPYLPRDCQYEIMTWLMGDGALVQRGPLTQHSGLQVRLRPHSAQSPMLHPPLQFALSAMDVVLYEARRVFQLDFQLSKLIHEMLDEDIFYLLCACGSVLDLQEFMLLCAFSLPSRHPEMQRRMKEHCICIAIKYGNLKVVEYFLAHLHLFDLKSNDATLHTIVCFAAQYGYLFIIRHLVEKFHSLNPARFNNYAIRCASRNGHLGIVQYLMNLGLEQIDPAADDNFAIGAACENGHLSTVKYLMNLDSKHGINPAAGDNYAIRSASEYGHIKVVKYLMGLDPVKFHIDPAADSNDSIRWAASRGHLNIVRYFLEEVDARYRIDPAANSNAALRGAAEYGHLQVVEYLMKLDPVKFHIDPSDDDNDAFRGAAENGHLDIVRYLMGLDSKHGINPAAFNNDAICWASEYGHLSVVKYLMALDAKYGIDQSIGRDYLIRRQSK